LKIESDAMAPRSLPPCGGGNATAMAESETAKLWLQTRRIE
jgi:hypothetical protein